MGEFLEPGTKAPAFNLKSDSGKSIKLADFKGQPVVLYFYPKDDTPGCTREACAFRDLKKEMEKAGAVVLGVSPDSVESHGKFRDKFKLNFPLLADTDGAVGRAYGTIGGPGLHSKLKSAAGMADRVTFVIDEKGRIAHVIDKPDVANHAEEVIALL